MREVLILLAATACTSSPPDLEIVQIERKDACTHNYPCQPGTPWSAVICDAVCDGGGYCEPYAPQDEEWCVLHPGIVENGRIMCDWWGNPTWQTRCAPGWVP